MFTPLPSEAPEKKSHFACLALSLASFLFPLWISFAFASSIPDSEPTDKEHWRTRNKVRPREKKRLKKKIEGISLVVQWLRLHNPNAVGLGSIPGQGTRSHILKLTHGAAKQISKINIFLKIRIKTYIRVQKTD